MKRCILVGCLMGICLVVLLSGCGGGNNSSTPDPPVREVLHYDGDPANGGGGTDHYSDALVYFNSTKLLPYIGYKVVGVRIFYHGYEMNDDTLNYNVRVYGKGSATQPGTELYKQDHTFNKGQWNDVILPTSIPITADTEIWAGFEVYTHRWPISYDDQPLVPGVNFSKLSTQTDYDVNATTHNFNIRIIVEK